MTEEQLRIANEAKQSLDIITEKGRAVQKFIQATQSLNQSRLMTFHDASYLFERHQDIYPAWQKEILVAMYDAAIKRAMAFIEIAEKRKEELTKEFEAL